MVFCENCIHYEVCEIDYDMMSEEVLTFFPHNEDCKLFKATADVVEVKHGEWHLLDDCANEGVYCSVCHKKVYRKDYANQKLKSNFCPNCGADMRGEK